jgi:hypothetical protein
MGAEMNVGVNMKRLLMLPEFDLNWNLSTYLRKLPNNKFH